MVQTNVTNKISNSLISPNKMEPLQNSVNKSGCSNNVVSKSLPNRVQEIPNLGQKGQTNSVHLSDCLVFALFVEIFVYC
jgi:hypothetical protein